MKAHKPMKLWMCDSTYCSTRYVNLYLYKKIHHVFDMNDVGEILQCDNCIYFEVPKIHQYQLITDYKLNPLDSFHLDIASYHSTKSAILYYKSKESQEIYYTKDEFAKLYPKICEHINEHKITYGQKEHIVNHNQLNTDNNTLKLFKLNNYDFEYRRDYFLNTISKYAYRINLGEITKPTHKFYD